MCIRDRDEPLSSLDAELRTRIVKNCIVGRLAGKTRIWATRHLEFASAASRVILLDSGRIVFNGTYYDFIVSEKSIALVNKLSSIGQRPVAKREATSREKSLAHARTPENMGKLVVEEDYEKDRVNCAVYKRYLSALGGAKSVVLLALIMIVWTVTSILSDLVLGLWKLENDISFLWLNFGLGTVSVLFIAFRVLFIFHYSLQASKKLHNEMLTRIMNAPTNSFFDKTPTGRIINRLSSDLNCVDTDMPVLIGDLQMALWKFVATLILSVILTRWSVLPMPFVIAGLVYYLNIYLQLQRKLKRLEKLSRSPIFQCAEELYSGAPTIRAYGFESRLITRSYTTLDDNLKCGFNSVGVECWGMLRVELVTLVLNVFTISLMLIQNYYNESAGVRSLLGLALSYMVSVEESVRRFFGNFCNLETSMVSAERCYAYTELEQEDENIVETEIKGWPENGDIRFENYSVGYDSDRESILKGITLEINSGERIGIIGKTGSGKSTFCIALLRTLKASSGRIVVSGQDIARIALKKLRESICVIPQETCLFEGTLKFNIDPTGKYIDKEVKKVIKRVRLKELLKYDGNILEFMVILYKKS
eukprot:TRINITY_DN8055_c0_g2_i1.p1 TRINITY_DN8055_c0_g2~~TRINITY_DN8055_c0_g2_i1.p1  ORF type:complete len:592 (-),score=176.28 TRINITY_DN8055_c0_g2_i1:538-2313(-)